MSSETVDTTELELYQGDFGEVARNDPNFYSWILRDIAVLKKWFDQLNVVLDAEKARAIPATTDDLPEGHTNLYFTIQRARDAVADLIKTVAADKDTAITTSYDNRLAKLPANPTSVQGALDALASLFTSISGGSTASVHGFDFSSGGLLGNDEILGFGVWSFDITFTNADDKTIVESEVPAFADAVINFVSWIAGVRTVVGTATILAGTTTATVAWTAAPYTHPKSEIIEIHAPSPVDRTLAWVTGMVNGVPLL